MPVSRSRARRSSVSSGVPVVRSANYQRFFADQALVMPLGRDVDIAFLAIGPVLDRVVTKEHNDDTVTEMKMSPSFTEVGRVRVTPACGIAMSMSMLESMVSNGIANKAALITAIQAFVEPPEDEEAAESEVELAPSDE